MKFGIVGCGSAGTSITNQLIKNYDVGSFVFIDNNYSRAERLLDIASQRGVSSKASTTSQNKFSKALCRCDVVINSASPILNTKLLRFCLSENSHYIDLASDPFKYPESPIGTTLDEQLAFDERFRDHKLTAITNAGYSPGFTDIYVKFVCEKYGFQKLDSVKIIFGEKIDSDLLTISWSPYVLMLETLSPPTVWSGGKICEIDENSSKHSYEFPLNFGKIDTYVFSGHPELRTITQYLGIPVDYLEVRGGMFLGKHGLSELICNALRKFTAKKRYLGKKDIFNCLAESFEPSSDFVHNYYSGKIKSEEFCSVIEMVGDAPKNKKKIKAVTYLSLEHTLKSDPNSSVGAYIVSFVPSVLANLLAKSKINQHGILVPAMLKNSSEIVSKCFSMGLPITISEKNL